LGHSEKLAASVDVGTLPNHVNSPCIIFSPFSLYYSLNLIVSTIPNKNFLHEWSSFGAMIFPSLYTWMASLNCNCRNSVLHNSFTGFQLMLFLEAVSGILLMALMECCWLYFFFFIQHFMVLRTSVLFFLSATSLQAVFCHHVS
jgi:hypothetical protein